MARKPKIIASGDFMVPYHKALEAMAYSGSTFTDAMESIKCMEFLTPPDNSSDYRVLRDNYDLIKKASRNIDSDYILTEHKIAELAIDPIFSWSQSDGNELICRAAKQVNKIIAESKHYGLRRIIDTLIMLSFQPQDIEESIQRSSKSPTVKWNSNEIAIYRSFFWDTGSMSAMDWARYFSWGEKSYRLSYVYNLIDTPVDSLLWEIGVPLNQSLDDAAEDMMRDCYIYFKKQQNSRNYSVKDMTALAKAFKELYAARFSKKASANIEVSGGDTSIDDLKLVLGMSGAPKNPAQHFDIAIKGERPAAEPESVSVLLDNGDRYRDW